MLQIKIGTRRKKTCEVKQAVMAERQDQLSDEGMKMLGAEGRKTPTSGIKCKNHRELHDGVSFTTTLLLFYSHNPEKGTDHTFFWWEIINELAVNVRMDGWRRMTSIQD